MKPSRMQQRLAQPSHNRQAVTRDQHLQRLRQQALARVPEQLGAMDEDRPDPALKGVKGGNCNRQACQKPDAVFDIGTGKFYCVACARDMHDFDKRVDPEHQRFPNFHEEFEALKAQRRAKLASKMDSLMNPILIMGDSNDKE